MIKSQEEQKSKGKKEKRKKKLQKKKRVEKKSGRPPPGAEKVFFFPQTELAMRGSGGFLGTGGLDTGVPGPGVTKKVAVMRVWRTFGVKRWLWLENFNNTGYNTFVFVAFPGFWSV